VNLLKVEKGKLSERIGRKVMGLKLFSYGCQTTGFYFFIKGRKWFL